MNVSGWRSCLSVQQDNPEIITRGRSTVPDQDRDEAAENRHVDADVVPFSRMRPTIAGSARGERMRASRLLHCVERRATRAGGLLERDVG